jgi:hypothetical protein
LGCGEGTGLWAQLGPRPTALRWPRLAAPTFHGLPGGLLRPSTGAVTTAAAAGRQLNPAALASLEEAGPATVRGGAAASRVATSCAALPALMWL